MRCCCRAQRRPRARGLLTQRRRGVGKCCSQRRARGKSEPRGHGSGGGEGRGSSAARICTFPAARPIDRSINPFFATRVMMWHHAPRVRIRGTSRTTEKTRRWRTATAAATSLRVATHTRDTHTRHARRPRSRTSAACLTRRARATPRCALCSRRTASSRCSSSAAAGRRRRRRRRRAGRRGANGRLLHRARAERSEPQLRPVRRRREPPLQKQTVRAAPSLSLSWRCSLARD